jgi:hypothetical protein
MPRRASRLRLSKGRGAQGGWRLGLAEQVGHFSTCWSLTVPKPSCFPQFLEKVMKAGTMLWAVLLLDCGVPPGDAEEAGLFATKQAVVATGWSRVLFTGGRGGTDASFVDESNVSDLNLGHAGNWLFAPNWFDPNGNGHVHLVAGVGRFDLVAEPGKKIFGSYDGTWTCVDASGTPRKVSAHASYRTGIGGSVSVGMECQTGETLSFYTAAASIHPG